MKRPCLLCLIGALIVVLLATFGIKHVLAPAAQAPNGEQPEPSTEDMIRHGQRILAELKAKGVDVDRGPCLDNGETFPGWVIDVAHKPREARDDLFENQCSAYRSGSASKFIELAPDGTFIRSYP